MGRFLDRHIERIRHVLRGVSILGPGRLPAKDTIDGVGPRLEPSHGVIVSRRVIGVGDEVDVVRQRLPGPGAELLGGVVAGAEGADHGEVVHAGAQVGGAADVVLDGLGEGVDVRLRVEVETEEELEAGGFGDVVGVVEEQLESRVGPPLARGAEVEGEGVEVQGDGIFDIDGGVIGCRVNTTKLRC